MRAFAFAFVLVVSSLAAQESGSSRTYSSILSGPLRITGSENSRWRAGRIICAVELAEVVRRL
jgi:hypothetical protein